MAKAKASKAKKTATPSDGKRSVRTIEIAGSLPCDLDTAGLALENAAGVIDALSVACRGVDIPDAFPGSLAKALNAALSEVRRADEALFGKGAA
jgi:hypothetical protein